MLLRAKGALDETHVWRSPVARLNSQYVEPMGRRIDSAHAKELLRHAGEIAAFLPINRILGQWRGGTHLGRGTRLHLDKCQNGTVVADNIDFALKTRKRVISRYQDVTLAAKIPIGIRLASNAGAAGLLFGRFG